MLYTSSQKKKMFRIWRLIETGMVWHINHMFFYWTDYSHNTLLDTSTLLTDQILLQFLDYDQVLRERNAFEIVTASQILFKVHVLRDNFEFGHLKSRNSAFQYTSLILNLIINWLMELNWKLHGFLWNKNQSGIYEC